MGTFAQEYGASSCTVCPDGTYGPVEGALSRCARIHTQTHTHTHIHTHTCTHMHTHAYVYTHTNTHKHTHTHTNRGTSLMRTPPPVGPYSRAMPRALSGGGGVGPYSRAMLAALEPGNLTKPSGSHEPRLSQIAQSAPLICSYLLFSVSQVCSN